MLHDYVVKTMRRSSFYKLQIKFYLCRFWNIPDPVCCFRIYPGCPYLHCCWIITLKFGLSVTIFFAYTQTYIKHEFCGVVKFLNNKRKLHSVTKYNRTEVLIRYLMGNNTYNLEVKINEAIKNMKTKEHVSATIREQLV